MVTKEQRFYEVRGSAQSQLRGFIEMPGVDLLALNIAKSILEASNLTSSCEQMQTLFGRLNNMLTWAMPAYNEQRFPNTSKFCTRVAVLEDWFALQHK